MATKTGSLVIAKEGGEEIKVDYTRLRRAVLLLRALNHPLRKQILQMLDEQKKLTVTEIYKQLKIEQSVASQHLAILRRSSIALTKREGKFIYYSVNEERLQEINSLVDELTLIA